MPIARRSAIHPTVIVVSATTQGRFGTVTFYLSTGCTNGCPFYEPVDVNPRISADHWRGTSSTIITEVGRAWARTTDFEYLPLTIVHHLAWSCNLTTKVSGPVADWRGLERHRGWRLESWGVERQELSGGQRALIPDRHPIPPRILDRNAPGESESRAPSAPPCWAN